LKNKKKNLVF